MTMKNIFKNKRELNKLRAHNFKCLEQKISFRIEKKIIRYYNLKTQEEKEKRAKKTLKA